LTSTDSFVVICLQKCLQA